MLKAKAEIQFTLEGRNFRGGNKGTFRPIFNFGKDYLFTGAVKSPNEIYLYNKIYEVDIDFFTITDEALDTVRPLLKKDMDMAVQESSTKIIGIAKITDFIYA